MKLTDDQKAFVRKHITGLSKKEGRRKTAAYVDFLRRNAKVLAELDKLRGSDEYLAELDGSLGSDQFKNIAMGQAEAEALARDGRFEEAYASLESVKNLARTAAKGYVDGLTYENIRSQIERLKDDAADAMLPIEAVNRKLRRAKQQVETGATFASPLDALAEDGSDEARSDLLEMILGAKADLLLELEGIRAAAEEAAKALDMVEIPGRIERLGRQIKVAKTYGAKKQRRWLDGLDALLDDAPTEAFSHDRLLNGQQVSDDAAARIAEVTDLIDQRLTAWMRDFQQRDHGPAPTAGTVSGITGKASGTSYEDAEKKYGVALEKAKQRFKEDSDRDQGLVAQDPLPIPKAKQLATYKIGDALPSDLAEKLRGLAPMPEGVEGEQAPLPDEQDIETAALAAADHVSKTMRESDPGSDVVFDLLLKDKAMFLKELAAELGWDRDPKKWSAEQVRAGDRIATVMDARMRQDCPNKLSDDSATFTFDGKTYSGRQKLGQGGLGTVYRYTCDTDGSSIVMKTPSNDRGAMVAEMRAHRLAMGGEGGKGDPNLVSMLGGLTDSSGGLHMLMEECSGGEVDDFGTAMNQAVESGALPPEARNALLRTMFGEMAKGLKHLKDQGLTHNDIKGANYLMDAKGTMKIADLGSGRVVDDEGKTQMLEGEESIPQTMKYVSPEGAETSKSDVFSLGAMLDILGSGQAPASKPIYFMNDKRQTGHTATSFDRLRNAMLDKDPDKRPTIEAVLMSSYVDEALENEESGAEQQDVNHEGNITELKLAIIAYSKGPGRKIAKLESEISTLQSRFDRDSKNPRFADLVADFPEKIAGKRDEIAAISESDDCQRLLGEITMAANLGSRTPEEDKAGSKMPRPPRESAKTQQDRYGALPPLPN